MSGTEKPICPYCNEPALLVDGKAIYQHRDDLHHLKFWLCRPCDAYVGCHKFGAPIDHNERSDGTVPFGRLANAELRHWKGKAHKAFDPIWKSNSMSRRAAYRWLAGELKVQVEECHIGMFDTDQCKAVIEAVARSPYAGIAGTTKFSRRWS